MSRSPARARAAGGDRVLEGLLGEGVSAGAGGEDV